MNTTGIPNPDTALRKGGVIVAELTKPANTSGGDVTVDELVVKGDLSGQLTYQGTSVVVDSIQEIIGLEVTSRGPRGPIWRGVHLKVVK
jgi:hypothetical protein